ncbi:hypothetical protein UFOVP967_12 [uncultured Caudovirales phage]|uniref:Uncharacterized protein n=1 Tax=uncultured Caudovirales phage TaxID=2100421 RepID=A0A6J5SPN2_9CAUD|nr:hypothetical protein UFOVP967_12 [uncultured Caudovirales phage]CAB4186351.1 hypothetical protein UFOVP1132_100 [uncultured Caudovirales phage]CAB4190591.1 hypothetical protein UFOVP1190_75 [uncultured Caudovirales phage]CAB4217472.1 hypothetical protein UFOVP1493_34 [uncultured Caudovirales phage]CAB5230956.1 hypothetical protein UFOVP1584_4 [uncultured Caudovirales phage]
MTQPELAESRRSNEISVATFLRDHYLGIAKEHKRQSAMHRRNAQIFMSKAAEYERTLASLGIMLVRDTKNS